MWVLPTFGRPGRCQDALDSIADAEKSEGVVIVDGDRDPAYARLHAPEGWRIIFAEKNRGICSVLNRAFDHFPNEPWYGFISDDSIVRTHNWQSTLVRAAGSNGFANSGDGWQASRRMHGAVVIGGDLVRALGFWAPRCLKHSFVDDAWEKLAGALENHRHAPQVLVEHRHRGNKKAETDATYEKAYSSFDDDRRAFGLWMRDEFPAAVARAIPVVADNVERARMMRARSRSVMIATPVARHPTYQFALSLTDTCLMFERLGIAHARQFVIGSSNLPRARNELVARFLASGCTDLLFIDDDMGWDANSALRLLCSDKPIAAVVGRKRVDKPNLDADVWCGRPVSNADGTGLIQDDMGFLKFEKVGTGFMKISREALNQIIAAHPEWKRAGHAGMSADVKANYYRFFRFGDDEFETGEDFEFCNAWRDLGGEIWVDPEQKLSHVGEKDYAGAFSEMLMPASPAEFKEAAE